MPFHGLTADDAVTKTYSESWFHWPVSQYVVNMYYDRCPRIKFRRYHTQLAHYAEPYHRRHSSSICQGWLLFSQRTWTPLFRSIWKIILGILHKCLRLSMAVLSCSATWAISEYYQVSQSQPPAVKSTPCSENSHLSSLQFPWGSSIGIDSPTSLSLIWLEWG